MITETNTSVSALSKILDASEKSVYNYLSGKNAPIWKVPSLLVQHFAGLSAHWLLTGDGEMWGKQGSDVHQVAGHVTGNGNRVNVAVMANEIEAMKRELEMMRELVREKDRVIQLLEERSP